MKFEELLLKAKAGDPEARERDIYNYNLPTTKGLL